MQSPIATASPRPELRRVLGRWDLAAIGVNAVIGGAIFLVPSQLAAQVGNWAPIAFLLAGLASLLVAFCFAEVGSRFDTTGGAYVYTRAAFGPFVAFEVGWMNWFTRVSSQASIVNGVALALAFYWPALAAGTARASLVTVLVVGIAVITARGIRQSAWLIDTLTVAKLAPLAVFALAGLWFVDWNRLTVLPDVSTAQAASAGFLLVFAYGGFDVIGVPAGEAKDPRHHLLFAQVATIATVTIVMAVVQLVAAGTLPNLASSRTPVADAAATFLGSAGALLIGVGSVLSMLGNNASGVLAGSRMLFALADDRLLPRPFATVHPRYRTPTTAIWFTAVVALGLALSGSFAALAAASAVSRLLTYAGVAGATLALRRQPEGLVPRAAWTIPFGPVIPALALAGSVLPIAGASSGQLVAGLAALLGGAGLYAFARVSIRA